MIKRRRGFTFIDNHSSEFRIRITSIVTPPPEMREIREPIPFMNGDWDFSFIMGRPIFNNRRISIDCFILADDIEGSMDDAANEIIAWLYGKGFNRLLLDHQENRYYTAKCVSCVPGEPDYNKGRIDFKIEFDAKPYANNVVDDSEVL